MGIKLNISYQIKRKKSNMPYDSLGNFVSYRFINLIIIILIISGVINSICNKTSFDKI